MSTQANVGDPPLAALSLLDLASSHSSQQNRSVPRAAATTSVSQSALPPYSAPTTNTTATSPTTTPNPNAFVSSRVPPSVVYRAAAMGMGNGSGTSKARRLSSASQSRRRLSDATAATMQAAAASDFARGTSVVSISGNLSAAAANLSLSTSPTAATSNGIPKSVLQALSNGNSDPADDGMDDGEVGTVGGQGGKKKGTIYRCENCSKVYRHPNCLLKHRWEHSPHWREASKFLLSKHQQVQLLEAAAILSHITPRGQDGNGTSLPEDRSLWPSYLSGGLLSAPSTKVPGQTRPSGLTATKARVSSSGSGGSARVKKDGSSSPSEEEVDQQQATIRARKPGSAPTSLPITAATATSALAGTPYAWNLSSKITPTQNQSTPNGTFGTNTFLTPGTINSTVPRSEAKSSDLGSGSPPSATSPFSGDTGAFRYGSASAAISTHLHRPKSSPKSPTMTSPTTAANGFASHSLQQQYLLSHNAPPYVRAAASNGRRTGRHRHTRTSSSISSSYTRSSVRGGGHDEDEEDEDDDMFDDDDGFGASASYVGGSAGTYPTSVSPGTTHLMSGKHIRQGVAPAEDYDFDVLDEKDEDGDETVDEESDGHQGGAGMEIDMDL